MINKTVGIVVGFLAAGLMFGCAKKSNVNLENAVETNPPNESTDIPENADPTFVEDDSPSEEELTTSYYFEEYDKIELEKDGAFFAEARGFVALYGSPGVFAQTVVHKDAKSLDRAIHRRDKTSINRVEQDEETVEQIRRDQDL